MIRFALLVLVATALAVPIPNVHADDWLRFRGPNGQGVSTDTTIPMTWSEDENLRWSIDLPGPGASSPIVVGDRVFVTCYSGYGESRNSGGEMEDLVRHLVCVHRQDGSVLWQKDIPASMPEDEFAGMGVPAHGYASNTPVSDGEAVYAFFGKTGVIAFDLDGEQLWHTEVGNDSGSQRWGSGSSPILHDDVVIVTASDESESMFALDKQTGDVIWQSQAGGFASVWGTPILMDVEGQTQILLSVPYEVWALNPENGKIIWYAEATNDGWVNTSIVADGDAVIALGERGGQAAAIRVGGRRDVSSENRVWSEQMRGNISSPIVSDGHFYWFSGGVLGCARSSDGQIVYQERLGGGGGGRGGSDYASPVVAGGRLYITRSNGTVHVVATGPEFEELAVNRFESDSSTFSGTPAISNGQMFIRSNEKLYCIESE